MCFILPHKNLQKMINEEIKPEDLEGTEDAGLEEDKPTSDDVELDLEDEELEEESL